MTQPDPHLPIEEWVLRDDRDVHIANVDLGVTFYLADPRRWAESGAKQALQHFLELAPAAWLRWFTTSKLNVWKAVTEARTQDLLDHLAIDWLGKPRHGFEFVIADDTGSEACGFRYVEVDPARVSRAALLELTLPSQLEPALLATLADRIVECGPIYCGIGGYALRYHPGLKSPSFTAAHGWAKRYLGFDIQDRDRMPWLVHARLPGVNWLNYLGGPWLEASGLDSAALESRRFAEPIAVRRSASGVRVVAGENPSVADLNHFEQPRAYEELARALAAHFVPAPPDLYGEFLRQRDAASWFRRHLDPAGWR